MSTEPSSERRKTPLTDEQIKELADILAPKLAPLVREELQQHFYSSVGKTVTEKVFSWIGIAALGFMAYLSAKGIIKWP